MSSGNDDSGAQPPGAAISGWVDHLFRREAGKMVAYLTRFFGLARLDRSEDIVQDTLMQALQTWPVHGLPDNPSAWLMRVARNRAIDLVRRDDDFRSLAPELGYLMTTRGEGAAAEPASDTEIKDDQLRMMLSCCHPQLSIDVQVTLILKTLCGFSVAEIASALFTGEDAIEKRLGRARKLFRESGQFVEVSAAADIPARLEPVYQAIYLLFSEGYHASQSDRAIREDLCDEAIHLAHLLTEHPQGARPQTFALLALFCFNAARLPGRLDADGVLVQLDSQDRSTWNWPLIGRGFAFLARSASETVLSAYHLEAAIAAVHSGAASYAQTNWARALELYDLLYALKPTPIVGLNRAIALGKARGPDAGLAELQRLPDAETLRDYPFLPAAKGEFHRLAGRLGEARLCFARARALSRNPSEARFLDRQIARLDPVA